MRFNLRDILTKLLLVITLASFTATSANALFVQPDWWEVTEPGVGTNRYAYSMGDPVNLSDPSGHATDRQISMGYAVATGVSMLGATLGTDYEEAFKNIDQYGADGGGHKWLADRVYGRGGLGIVGTVAMSFVGASESNTVYSEKTATSVRSQAEMVSKADVESSPAIYHRRVSIVEFKAVAISQMLWGQSAAIVAGGGPPSVKAYIGPLPAGVNGYEFQTPVPPSRTRNFVGGPGVVWVEDSPGVIDVPNIPDHVMIPVRVVDGNYGN